MRLFTFSIIAFATAISVNTASTEKLVAEKDISHKGCYTELENSNESVQFSWIRLENSDLEPTDNISAEAIIKIIENEKTNIVAGLQRIPLMCCETMDTGSTNLDTSFENIATLLTVYSDYLLYLDSKNSSFEKSSQVKDAVVDLIKTMYSTVNNFLECMSSNMDHDIISSFNSAVEGFSTVYNQVKTTYGFKDKSDEMYEI